jgi:hypothetical protein
MITNIYSTGHTAEFTALDMVMQLKQALLFTVKTYNVKRKTWLKQLLGFLLLVSMHPYASSIGCVAVLWLTSNTK